MVLDEGRVKELTAIPPPNRDSVPVMETNRQGIVDPLTAMLFSAAVTGEGLSPAACRQTLPIFDGRQRYDLKLAFKRMDKVTAEKGYSGPLVVCSVTYEPIAGHRSSTALVKYLSEGREMEMALAPVAGTRLLVPFRVSVVSILANLVIVANRFEATAQPAAVEDSPIRSSDVVGNDASEGSANSVTWVGGCQDATRNIVRHASGTLAGRLRSASRYGVCATAALISAAMRAARR